VKQRGEGGQPVGDAYHLRHGARGEDAGPVDEGGGVDAAVEHHRFPAVKRIGAAGDAAGGVIFVILAVRIGFVVVLNADGRAVVAAENNNRVAAFSRFFRGCR
jgi:hypothetical protein